MRLRTLVAAATLALPLACTTVDDASTTGAPGVPGPDAGEPAEPPPPPTTEVVVLDLGKVTAGEDVPFELPEGALGFNIVAEGSEASFDPEKPFGIERIVDPAGTVVHDAFTPTGGTMRMSEARYDTLAAASVPQSEAATAPLRSGTWTVRFGVAADPSASMSLDAKVRVQVSGDGAFHGGRLDLHVHVPPGLKMRRADGDTVVIDPAMAETEPAMTERMDAFFALLSSLVGIDRGDVTFHVADDMFTDIAWGPEARLAFGISEGMPDGTQTVHLVLTNSITYQGKEFAVGVSPLAPGPATIFGRGTSGIIIATSSTAEEDAHTMLHEIGHYIGLGHTSEIQSDDFDPIADTPTCPTIHDGDFDACPDQTNLMFVGGKLVSPVVISPTQKRVYQGSPIFKAYPAGTQRTMALSPAHLPAVRRTFRASGLPLSPVESELALGYCGIVLPDTEGFVRRHGRTATLAQLERASRDADLAPFIRGRAAVALETLTRTP